MNEKTMLKIAYEVLKEKEQLTLQQIMSKVEKELKSTWQNDRPEMSLDDITTIKTGELHKLLTIDGNFLRLKDASWTLVERFSPEEIQNIKMQVQEQLD